MPLNSTSRWKQAILSDAMEFGPSQQCPVNICTVRNSQTGRLRVNDCAGHNDSCGEGRAWEGARHRY